MQQNHSELAEHTISSETPFTGKLLRLRVDTVELPSGMQARREVVEHPGAVAIVPIDDEGNILMVRQWRHPICQASLEIPAGGLEPDEAVERCARRELVEETGFYPGELQSIGSIFVSPGYSNEIIHLFVAGKLQDQQHTPHPDADPRWESDPDENLRTVVLPLQDAVGMCATGEITDAKSISGILLVWERLRPMTATAKD